MPHHLNTKIAPYDDRSCLIVEKSRKVQIDPKTGKEIQDLIDKFAMEGQVKGMGHHEGQVKELLAKKGILETDPLAQQALAVARVADVTDKAAEAAKKLNGEIKSTTDSMQEEIATFGLSANQKRVWKLANEGADAATVAFSKSMADQLDLMQEAKKVHEEFRTPQEKYTEAASKLDKELKASLITQNEYAGGMKKIQEELNKAMHVSDKAKEKFQAVAYGSAEALARTTEYLESLKTPQTGAVIAAQFNVGQAGGLSNPQAQPQQGVAGGDMVWRNSVLSALLRIAANSDKAGAPPVQLNPANLG